MALAWAQQAEHTGRARLNEKSRRMSAHPPLAEEFDVTQRQLRGNLPQAFVHALLLKCAAGSARPGIPPNKMRPVYCRCPDERRRGDADRPSIDRAHSHVHVGCARAVPPHPPRATRRRRPPCAAPQLERATSFRRQRLVRRPSRRWMLAGACIDATHAATMPAMATPSPRSPCSIAAARRIVALPA